MNERLKEFLDFKNHTLKAVTTLFFLIVLNVLFWVFFIGPNNPIKLLDTLIFSFGVFFFIYICTLFAVDKYKGESTHLYILKNNLLSLKFFSLVYLVMFPIAYFFYSIFKSIIDSINPESQTFILMVYIGAAIFAIALFCLILYILEWLPAKIIPKEVEKPEEEKKEPIYLTPEDNYPDHVELEQYDMDKDDIVKVIKKKKTKK